MQRWDRCWEDENASSVITVAALAVWYPSLLKSNFAATVAPQFVNLVMAVNGRDSVAAAKPIAEGMEST